MLLSKQEANLVINILSTFVKGGKLEVPFTYTRDKNGNVIPDKYFDIVTEDSEYINLSLDNINQIRVKS